MSAIGGCRGYCRLLFLLGAGLTAGAAWTQDGEVVASDYEIDWAVWRPSLRASGFYTDNFYNQPTKTESSYGSLINPRLGYKAEAGRLTVNSSLSAELGTFDAPGTADDFLDAEAGVRLGWNAGTRNLFALTAGFTHGHDQFGVDRTEDAGFRDSELDRWNRAAGGLRYRFGAIGAVFNSELGVAGQTKHYITNRTATQVLEYDSIGADYGLYYNYSPKSSVLLDFARTDHDFDVAFTGPTARDRGGVLYRVRVGTRWHATAKTSGDVRIGHRRRNFDDGSPPSEGIDWQAGVQWVPRAKSTFNLRTARSEQESYRSDTRFIDVKSASLGWTQTLTARLRSQMTVGGTRATFVGSQRVDDILSGGLEFEYLLRRYLYLQLNSQYLARDSSAPPPEDRDYDRVNGYIGFRLGR